MSELSEATRPIMWNIDHAWAMYALFGIAMVFFIFGLKMRIARWRRAQKSDERLADWGKRAWILIGELLLQRKVRGSKLPGIFHSALFYGFVALVITTAVVALDYDFGTRLFVGYLYVGLTLLSEVAGVAILVGIVIALVRRLLLKPATLETSFKDLWPLYLVGLIIISGFAVEGVRIATVHDQWARLSPVGYGIALSMSAIFEGHGAKAHKILWWLHTAFAMGFIAVIPYTKFFHLISLPTNIFFSKLEPKGQLKRIDILALMELDDFDDDDFNVGVGQVEDFTWKQRLDMDACLSCGRCEEVCPAHQAKMPFSPKQFIARCKEASEQGCELVGSAFDEQFIWHCRACMACMEVCPANVEHVDTVIDVRRNEVLVNGRVPEEAARALRQMDTTGNPFGTQGDREEWIKSLGVRVVGPGERVDVLYWTGCCTAFDPTKQQIAVDVCNLLEQCGLEFGVLGRDETCCGDPARIMGEERLFQELASEQVKKLGERQFDVLLTSCPHCYNVLKNEYPQFGGDYNVVHHSEFLHEMVWAGTLAPQKTIDRKVVYHDPCYLGRVQEIYESPREVLKAITGSKVCEMSASRERSLCCGGGGGHFWMDLRKGERINAIRVQQALDAGADTIVTSCAYCNQMLDDAIKNKDLEEQLEVVDIVSLMVRAGAKNTSNGTGDNADKS